MVTTALFVEKNFISQLNYIGPTVESHLTLYTYLGIFQITFLLTSDNVREYSLTPVFLYLWWPGFRTHLVYLGDWLLYMYLLQIFGQVFNKCQSWLMVLCNSSISFFYFWSSINENVRTSPCNVEDLGSIPGLGRSPGEGKSNPLQYSCLGNPMDREVWWPRVCGVTKSQTEQLTL